MSGVFNSDLDSKYYFWIGDGLRGPFDDYNEAHLELAKIKESDAKKASQEGKQA